MMNTHPNSLDRRRFLSRLGVASSSLLLNSMIEGLIRDAYGAEANNFKLILFGTPHGIHPDLITGTIKNLPPILRPLDSHSSDLVVIKNLVDKSNAGGIHGNNRFTFSCFSPGDSSIECRSFDQEIALNLYKNMAYPSIAFGISSTTRLDKNAFVAALQALPSISQVGKQVITPLTHPEEILSNLFSSTKGVNTNILNQFIKDDAKQLISKLAGEEKQKLDSYIASIEGLNSRLTKLGELGVCAKPTFSGNGQTKESKNVTHNEFPDKLDFICKSAVTALACNLTNVVSIGASPYIPRMNLAFVNGGKGTDDYHNLCHANNLAMIQKILTYFATKIGGMWEDLKKHGIADKTVIVWLSSNGGRHHGGDKDIPIITLGTLSGRLKSGFYAKKNRSTREYFVTIANAMGHKIQKFGSEKAGPCSGPFSDILDTTKI